MYTLWTGCESLPGVRERAQCVCVCVVRSAESELTAQPSGSLLLRGMHDTTHAVQYT